MNFYRLPIGQTFKWWIVRRLKYTRNELTLFISTNSGIKKYSYHRMMILICSNMIKVHFQIIMAAINCVLWWWMEVKLYWAEHLIFMIWFVYYQVSIYMIDLNPNRVSQVRNMAVGKLTIISIKCELVQSFKYTISIGLAILWCL
jgi:hypothetical protein